MSDCRDVKRTITLDYSVDVVGEMNILDDAQSGNSRDK